jgi:hypothetical protein
MRHDRLQLPTRTMHGLMVHHRDVLGFDAICKGLCEQHEEAKAEIWSASLNRAKEEVQLTTGKLEV